MDSQLFILYMRSWETRDLVVAIYKCTALPRTIPRSSSPLPVFNARHFHIAFWQRTNGGRGYDVVEEVRTIGRTFSVDRHSFCRYPVHTLWWAQFQINRVKMLIFFSCTGMHLILAAFTVYVLGWVHIDRIL